MYIPLLATLICIFQPPTDWEIAQLKVPAPNIHIGFLSKGTDGFRPSINLATEDVEVSLKEYVKAVKEIHTADPKIRWRDLGKFATQAGEGRLIELSNSSPWGKMKIFQAIVVKEGTAYILTAAVLNEDLSKYQASILNSFHSLTLIPDLWTPITDSEKRKEIQNLFASLGKTDDIENQKLRLQQLVDSHSQLGPYWQFLALRDGLAKLSL